MRSALSLLAVASVGVAVMSLAAPTASAAAGDTVTTFALTGGALSVVVAPTAVLSDLTPNAGTSATATGTLGPVTVTDLRGGSSPWLASAASTQFTSVVGTGGSAVTSRSSKVEYQAGAITATGVITVAAGAKTELSSSPTPIVQPSALTGANTALWTPTLTVTLPPTAQAGLYTGTINTSVA